MKDDSAFAIDSAFVVDLYDLNKNDGGKLKSLRLINYKAENEMLCENCIFGKQCKLPHKMKHSKTNRSLELVHADIYGPITPTSYNNKNYFITFLDDLTHFCAVYFLKNKSNAFDAFKQHEAIATNRFNQRIRR